MKKIFDLIAVICAILFFIFAMALDSPSYLPIKICAVTAAYLFGYVTFKTKIGDCLELCGDEYDVD